MAGYLLRGIASGIAARISPGPMLALVISPGKKLGVALLVSRSRNWLTGRTHHILLAGSDLLLIGLGLLLAWEGVRHILGLPI
jgi:ABC-type nickel/cobalt efflux system permease component RcnA